MIWPLWALIRDLDVRYGWPRPASARKLDTLCLDAGRDCGGGLRARWAVFRLGVYARPDTKALTRSNRITPRHKLDLIKG